MVRVAGLEHLSSKQCVVGSNPTRAALFGEKRVVWVSCLSLFSIYRKEFSCTCSKRLVSNKPV